MPEQKQQTPIFQTKLARKREWYVKSHDPKCKRCQGNGYLGDLTTNPDFGVFCKCVILSRVPEDFDYDKALALKSKTP